MIRLGKKGWNNVIIFSMLFMVLLFNGMHKKIMTADEQSSQVSVLPVDNFILTIEFNTLKLERIGKSWRTSPASNHSQEKMQSIVDTWVNLTGESMPEGFSFSGANHTPVVATVWLAGHEQAKVFALYEELNTLYIHDVKQKQWIAVENAHLESLFLLE